MLFWILGVLAALGFLIGSLRIGVHVTLHQGTLAADVRVGPFSFRVFPGKVEAEPSQQDAPLRKAVKPRKKNGLSRPSVAEIRDLICTLWPPLKKALRRTRQSIRIDPLQLSVTVGGEEDPAASAQLYGELHGAVWTVMPALEQLLRIKDPYVHIGIDFDAGETVMEGTLGVSIRIGTLLGIVWSFAIPAIQWFLTFRKRHMRTQQKPSASAADPVN